jgi:integrase
VGIIEYNNKTQIEIGVDTMVATMTNEKNNSIFNAEVKNDYLEEMIGEGHISEETAKSYARIFNVTYTCELELEKDLNEFTLEEMEKILYGFNANNRNTIESYGRIISSYLNWSVNKGLIKKSVLADFRPESFEKYITDAEKYFTNRQLRRYEDRCENFQDAVIIRLLFMGVGGKQMSEIRNLKKSDIDRTNKRLKLTNTLKADKQGLPIKSTERWIEVDDRTIELIDGAIRQKEYVKKNGDLKQTEHNNVRPFTDLVNNEYVVRASITKTENWNVPVDKFVIYRRIQTIAESLGLDSLTAKFIQRSGMIYHANELIQDGVLSLDDMKIVADRFNMKSYHNLKGFLTVDNIRKTYPQK